MSQETDTDEVKHWQDRLTRASFRGFDFLTDEHDAKSGRRLVVHEFPGAEEPFVEDLGGKAWDYKLSAYFIGPDYDLERNGFLGKLNEPGADWLTHPWLGELWVRAHHWSVRESNDKGGFCTLSLEFVPGGLAPFAVTVDKVEVAFDRTRKFADAVVDDFVDEAKKDPNFLNGLLAQIDAALDFVRDLISLATLPLTWANQILRRIDSIKGLLDEVQDSPGAYANAFRNLTGLFGRAGDNDGFADTDRPRLVARLAASATATASGTFTDNTAPAASLPLPPAGEGRGEGDLNAFHARLFVAATAEAALIDYRAAEDRDAVLASVVKAVDTLLPSLPDPLFHAALDMRTAVIEALLAQDLTYRTRRAVALPLPAVVLAYRLDVTADDFLTVNRVRHPLFVRGEVRA